jgi:hypothetical protein
MKRGTKFLTGYLVTAICAIVATHEIWVRATQVPEIPYSRFQAYLSAGQVEELHADALHEAARMLLRDETMSREDLTAILSTSDCRHVRTPTAGATPAL